VLHDTSCLTAAIAMTASCHSSLGAANSHNRAAAAWSSNVGRGAA
jgi:hypothetical protein